MGSRPDPTTFDPHADGLPDALAASRLPMGGAGRVIVLLATGDAGSEEWARGAAISVARGWAAGGARVFLADTALTDPHLHEVLGLPNEEGVADMFRFGASVQRVAKRIEDLPFFFTSAGTMTYHPREVLASNRWGTLAEGFRDAGAALLLYLPASEPGAEDLLAQASDVLILGDEVPESLEEESAPPLMAWVTRESGAADGLMAREDVGSLEPPPDSPDAVEATPESDLVVVPEEDTLDPWGMSREAASELEPDSSPSPWTELDESPGEETIAEVPMAGVNLPDLGLSLDEAALVEEGESDEAPAVEVAPEVQVAPEVELEPVTDVVDEDEALVADELSPSWTEESPLGAQEALVAAPVSEAPEQAYVGASKEPRRSRPWVLLTGVAAVLALVSYQLWGSGLVGGEGAGGAGGEPPAGVSEEAPPVEASPEATPGAVAGGAETDPPAPDTPVEELTPAELGDPTSPLQGASLVIQSFPTLDEAQSFADRLSAGIGDLLFIVIPSQVRGSTWYRTVAGPARDIAEIPGIQERIEEASLPALAGRSGWFPRETGLAFLLDEVGTIEAADASAASYRSQSIPAYVLALDYDAGVRRYRVYAGGYAFERESAPLAQVIQSAGHPPTLVERLGSMPRGQ